MKKTLCAMAASMVVGFVLLTPNARAQTNSTWIGGATDGGLWSDTSLWNPHVVPNGNYNVTLPWNPSGNLFNGPELDLNVTLQNLTIINRLFLDNQSFPGTNLTVNGTTSITTAVGHNGETAAIFDDGGTWLFGTLANYDSSTHTLTDGFFFVFNGGTIGWRGADVITNDKGTLITSGATSKMVDQNNNLNAFRNLAVNNGGFTVADGYNFTTTGNFTNGGGLAVTTGNGATTVMTVTGSLTNFDAPSHTLTNGYYDVEVTNMPGTATLRFPNADIRTLVTATIKLIGAGASITDLNGLNALRNLAGIQSTSLTSAGTLIINPSGGTFTNDSSTHNIDSGANITVQGDHHSVNNGTTNVGAPSDTSNTTLTISGHSTIEGGGLDMGGQPGVNTQYHTELHVMNGIEFRGAYLTGTGTTFADVGLIQGSVLNPGHSPGQLTFQGNLTLDATTEVDIQLAGLSAGDEYDQLVHSGGTCTIGGNLFVTFLDGFEYVVSHDDTFDIFTSAQNLAGSFVNAASGTRIATNDGKGTFIISYNGDDKVTLSQFLPPPRVVDATKIPNQDFTIYFLGYPNSTYDLQASSDLSPDSFQTIASLGTGDGADYSVFATQDSDSHNHTRRFYRVVYPQNPQEAHQSKSAKTSAPRAAHG